MKKRSRLIILLIGNIYAQNGHISHGVMNLHEKNHATIDTMIGMYGNYSLHREASGTSWMPDSSPLEYISLMRNNWHFMIGGYSHLVYDKQTGPCDAKAWFDANMFMYMGHAHYDKNLFGFRTAISLEPITMSRCGYPLLFQTGETCNGKTPLINRQHPHDFFMELAATYARLITEKTSVFLYIALPGEPALGPPVYMMRFASEYIPAAPLSHHWLDSTHISYGVITGGIVHNNIKGEISGFKGREPNQQRFDIEKPKIDSYAFRASYNPNEQWSLQISYGFLKSPEQLEPTIHIGRTTASVIYNKNVLDTYNWQTILAVGINNKKPGRTLPAFLLDSTWEYRYKHMLFGRFESVRKDELFLPPDPCAGKSFLIHKFSFGYMYEGTTKHSKWGFGGSFDAYIVPPIIDARYKIDSISYMLFVQCRIADY